MVTKKKTPDQRLRKAFKIREDYAGKSVNDRVMFAISVLQMDILARDSALSAEAMFGTTHL